MNSKRQTVWLVSMLSLMVVLSAYYLFTEDVSELDLTATEPKGSEVVINTNDLNAAGTAAGGKTEIRLPSADGSKETAAKPDSSQPEPSGEAKAEPKDSSANASTEKAPSAAGDKPSSADGGEPAQPVSSSAGDAQVLEQVQQSQTAQAGEDYFIGLQMKRNEEIAKKVEQLMTISADTKQTAEAAVKAEQEIRKIQEMEAKIDNLEETLMKDFPLVAVTQEANKWKVTVQAQKLEKSQVVSITDLMFSELGVSPEQVAVAYRP